jgi:ABC-type antimicrobial peptide transport system permease subunit
MEISCKIVDQMDIIPGIDPGVMEIDGYSSEFVGHLTIDSSCLNMHPSLLDGFEMIQLINYNTSLQIPQEVLEAKFKNLLEVYSHYQVFAFYEEISDVSYTAFSAGSGYYGIVYMDLLVIGVFFSISIALFLNTTIQQDRFMYGILLSRGFGRKGVIKYAISQWLVIVIIPLIISIIIGGISAIMFAKIIQFMTLRSLSLFSVPVYANFLELGLIFAGIFIVSFIMSILPFILGSKKEISQYLHKF